MKSIYFLLFIIGVLFSCQKEDEPDITFNIPKKDYSVESIGGTIDIFFQTDATFNVEIEQKEWLHSVSTRTLQLNMLSLACDPNPTSAQRTSKVIFTIPNSDITQTVVITQKAADSIEPRIVSFVFEAAKNPQLLIEDIAATINEDGTISAQIPYIIPDKNLVPTIKLADEQTTWIKTPETTDNINFSSPVKITIENTEGNTKEYEVSVYAFTGLPVVYIHTENDAEISSKEEYVNAHIRIVEDIHTRSGDIFESDVTIKGRGNSTWSLPKKPYALKFSKKTSLLGEPKDKSWVLLANYTDKTNLRNETSFYLGRISNLEWTPRTHFVELFINEVYYGTYQLCEKIKIAESRVNVTDDGYLLEIDQPDRIDPEDASFKTSLIAICVKDPDIEINGERHKWISNYVNTAEKVLLGDNFLDENEGYAKYFDKTSFADWYLINEITKNNDGCFFSSCYMNIVPGGKLKMGPLWDFDIALGNVNYNNNQSYEGFWIKEKVTWFSRMFKDPSFLALVKERLAYFKSRKNDILLDINENATYLKYSVIENNAKWGTLYQQTWPNYAVWGSYSNEVQYLKQWLDNRFDWLEKAFSEL
ncbi:CotH kinase family protein [Bacteroides sp.]